MHSQIVTKLYPSFFNIFSLSVVSLYNSPNSFLFNGCIYLPNLLADKNDLSLFNKLKYELFNETNLVNWSKHHKIDNPTDSPTFNLLIELLKNYFNINVLATRLNYYTGTDYKPFHHDSHAFANGLKEDITIGLSLGSSRKLAFKHVETENIFSFPQNNGDVFCFDHLTNKKFQHGVLKNSINNSSENIRISIIFWGKKN
jgi:hypothetical protein